MKTSLKTIFAVVFILAAGIFCYGFIFKKPTHKTLTNKSEGFAVIELFTSEGCSSCPAADELVAKILAEKQKDVYILSYHVDYWNRLGWTDEFSKAEYSNRQRKYAKFLSPESIYTPQIVVNGEDEFVGSNESKLRSAIEKRSAETTSNLVIQVSKTGTNNIHISYDINSKAFLLLNIALVQPEATTDVKKGENSGHVLHHVNIVRELKTIEVTAAKGNLDMQIPTAMQNHPLELIAFTQQTNDFKITGVAQSDIN